MDNVHSTILKESSQYLQDMNTVVEDLKQSGISDHTMLLKDSSFLDSLQQIGTEKDTEENDVQ